MVFFNYALRKLNAKIVYYGPGLCGKTTNLAWIHDHFEGGSKGKMISLATEGDRTIFFDLLPLEIGSIRGMDVTLQLYTVPGQVHYNSTRQLVLRGADGVVFVADSQRAMKSSNIESFKNLQENLLLQGISLEGFPLVLQFNKRDLRDTLTVEELNEDLNRYLVPIFEATATEGIGVQETLEGIVKLVMRSLRERYEGAGGPKTPGLQDLASPGALGGTAIPPASTPAMPPLQQPVKPPAADKPADVPPPQTGEPGITSVPPPAAAPPAAAPPPAEPPAETTPPQQPAAVPPPQQPAPEPEPAAPPAASTPPPPPIAEEPGGDVFAFNHGAPSHDLPQTSGPDTIRAPSTGFEDEVATDVYELGDEEPFTDIRSDPGFQAPSSAPPPVGDVELPDIPVVDPEIELMTPEEDIAAPDVAGGSQPAEPPPWLEPPAVEPPPIETPPVAEAPVDPPPTLEAAPESASLMDDVAEPAPFVEAAPEPASLMDDVAEPAPYIEATPESASLMDDMAELASLVEVPPEPASLMDDMAELASFVEAPPEPASLMDDMAEPASFVEAPPEPASLMDDMAEPAVAHAFDAATAAPIDEGVRYEDRIDAPSPFAPQPGLERQLSPEAFESLVAGQAAAEAARAAEEAEAALIEEAAEAIDEPEPEPESQPLVEFAESAGVEETPDLEPYPAVDSLIPEVGDAEPIVVSGVDPFAEPSEDDAAAIAGTEAAAVEVEEEGDAAYLAGADAIDMGDVVDAYEEMEIEVEIDDDPGDATEPTGEVAEPASLYEEAEAAAAAAAIEPATSREVDVAAEDNQLHLRLQGTGAIVESGQVRELDIEVPVPGAWVGHRRVTLQLRLTLTPDSEDDNDGTGGSA